MKNNIEVTKVIKVRDHDRYIFVTYDNNENVIGLNFHQGLECIDAYFLKEKNEPLTAIYKYLVGENDSSPDFFNECVERYCSAFIYYDMKNE